MFDEERKRLEKEMSLIVPKQNTVIKTRISLNEDTKFLVNFDLYQNYLYIAFSEETAHAPFIYDKSYSFEELKNIHAIFGACNNLKEIKDRINQLFKNKRVSINLIEKGEKIEIILEPDFWIGKISIKLEIDKEMVPKSEKDKKLIELYEIVKKNYIKLKNISSYIQSNEAENPTFINLINQFKNFDIFDTENDTTAIDIKNENKKDKYVLEYDNEIVFNLNEISEDNKPKLKIKLTVYGDNLQDIDQKISLVRNKKESSIKMPVEIKKSDLTILENKQEWTISVTLEKEDPGEYIAFFNLKKDEQILEDEKVVVLVYFQ